MLSTLATRVACTICHHEAYRDKHHGNQRMDMHHAPVIGAVPLGAGHGCAIGWWHTRDAVSWYAWFQYPDGHDEVLRRWPDGRSEVVPLDWAHADAYTQFELSAR